MAKLQPTRIKPKDLRTSLKNTSNQIHPWTLHFFKKSTPQFNSHKPRNRSSNSAMKIRPAIQQTTLSSPLLKKFNSSYSESAQKSQHNRTRYPHSSSKDYLNQSICCRFLVEIRDKMQLAYSTRWKP